MAVAPTPIGLVAELEDIARPRPSILPELAGIRTRKHMVFSLGNPRAGTTLLYQMLQICSAGHSTRIPEGMLEHPRNSADGLLKVAGAFPEAQAIFLRIVRHPVDTFDSLFHWKPYFFDSELYEYELARYRDESDNWHRQGQLITSADGLWFVTVKYDKLLADVRGLTHADLPDWLRPDIDRWIVWLTNNFDQHPVRPGKLSDNKAGELLMDRRRYDEICDRLGDVIRREGLHTWLGR